MEDNEVHVKISGDSAEAKTAFHEASEAVTEGVAHMKEHLAGLGEAFEFVMEHLEGFTALLAGGMLFKEGIDTTKELTEQTLNMSRAMGISTEESSEMAVTLGKIGVSTQTYIDANAKLTRQLRTNEDAVKAMGVATRDSSGKLLSGKEIMQNAIEALKGYKEGTDRNLAGQQLFGRSAGELNELLELNNEEMKEGAERAEKLGLVLSEDQVSRTKLYIDTMHEVKQVLEGVQNVIGQALIPILQEAAEWFVNNGPTAVSMMRDAMGTFVDILQVVWEVVTEVWDVVVEAFDAIRDIVVSAFGQDMPDSMNFWKNVLIVIEAAVLALKLTFELAFEIIRSAIEQTVAWIMRFADVATHALTLDFSGAVQAWRDGAANIERVIDESQKRIIEKTQHTAEEMARVLNGERAVQPEEGKTIPSAMLPKGDKGYVKPNTGPDPTLKARMQLLKAQLEGELALHKEYLSEAQAAYDYAYKHNLLSIQDYYAAKLTIEQEGLKDSIRVKDEELRQNRQLQAGAKAEKDKLQLKVQEAQITAQLAVLTAKLASTEIANARELNDELKKRADAMAQIQSKATQNAGKSQIDLEKVLLDQKKALHEVTNEQALQQERQFEDRLYAIDKQAIEDRRALADGDPVKLAQINADLEDLERQHQVKMASIDKDIVLEQQKNVLAAQTAIENAGETMIADLGNRSKGIKQIFSDLAASIEKTFLDLAAKNIMKNVLGSISGGGGGGNWLGNLLGGGSGGGGNFLGSIMSSVFGGVPKFAEGTEYVPNDMLAVIHKGERITPAKYNKPSAATSNSGPISISINVPPTTGSDTAQQIALHAGMAVQRALRRGA